MTPAGALYVVATPIGNLDDISSRARAVLESVVVIAAEDTRRTQQLLTHLGLRKPVVSLHEHNESRRTAELLRRLEQGETVALVSDAGTPLISDPGYRLVSGARQRGLKVTPIPGCCAAIAALSVAGLPSNRFHFEGFLPGRAAARRGRLQELRNCADTVIFYEAVHRIQETLEDVAGVFGHSRPAFAARELTKLHETTYYGTLAEIRAAITADPGGGKGEFTLVVAGAPESVPGIAELERVVRILAADLPASDAGTLAARITGASRRDAYALAVRLGKPPNV